MVHHDEAFDHWLELWHRAPSAFPLDVVHVDSHADLGCRECAWIDLAVDVLHRPPEERWKIEHREGGLTPGSYLLYACSCRWIASLEYVYHPKGLGDDIDPPLLGPTDLDSKFLYVGALGQSQIDALRFHRAEAPAPPATPEPPIPFQRTSGERWRNTAPLDRVILCQSPDYTPVESDALLPIFWDYIDFRCEPPVGVAYSNASGRWAAMWV